MCAVSNIGDYGQKRWPDSFPNKMPGEYHPYDKNPWVPAPGQTFVPPPYNGPTKEQFAELIKLLKAAAEFDKATGQPHCEQDTKLAWLKAIAKHLGVPEPVL